MNKKISIMLKVDEAYVQRLMAYGAVRGISKRATVVRMLVEKALQGWSS